MTVLIDTSVWVDHFRNHNDDQGRWIEMERASVHSMVVIELACGTPPAPRHQTLSDIDLLQKVKEAGVREVLSFIERERLYGLGCGLVDMSLLASVLITPGAQLWTFDKSLSDLANRFNVLYQPRKH